MTDEFRVRPIELTDDPSEEMEGASTAFCEFLSKMPGALFHPQNIMLTLLNMARKVAIAGHLDEAAFETAAKHLSNTYQDAKEKHRLANLLHGGNR